MAVDGILCGRRCGSGRNPARKYQIQPECGERPGSHETGRPSPTLARPNSQARTETGEKLCFSVRLTTSRVGYHTQSDPYSAESTYFMYVYMYLILFTINSHMVARQKLLQIGPVCADWSNELPGMC